MEKLYKLVTMAIEKGKTKTANKILMRIEKRYFTA
jgi:TolA-binding protein